MPDTPEKPAASDRAKVEGQTGRGGGGESAGGSYPNPHDGKGAKSDAYGGHGGQTDMEYHGTGRLGRRRTGDNENAPAREDGDED